jgi:hypothetical protein
VILGAIEAVRAALAVVHVGAAATWLGAMVHSRVVVQPRAARFFERSDDQERFAAALAAGARAKMLALCAALALSGAGLVATDLTEADDPDALWLALVGAKIVLLAIGIALFVWVSWRLWPLRVFALPAELAASAAGSQASGSRSPPSSRPASCSARWPTRCAEPWSA